MNKSPDRLYELLPAIHRIRDAEKGYPLRDVLRVIAEQVNVVEADIAQLYDNWFIETCQDWVVPYIGDLIDYQSVPSAGQLGNATTTEGEINKIFIPRQEVADTLGYRRRKGTLALLESLAYKVTGWSSRVVEFYQFLSSTQNINHLGFPNKTTVNLRQVEALKKLDSPFDQLAHLVDIRRIISQYQMGEYNIPSVGIFVCRLKAYSVTRTPAYCLQEVRSNCYTFSVTTNDIPLYNHPQSSADSTKIVDKLNLPIPISRKALQSSMSDYYDSTPDKFNQSLEIYLGNGSQMQSVPSQRIIVADLSQWNYQTPKDHIAVDPELGRMIFPSRQLPQNGVWVSYHYGFSADIGGGEYHRSLLNPEGHLLLRAEDIQDSRGLITKLNDNSALSQFLRSQFSLHTQELLSDRNSVYSLQAPLIRSLVEELNQLLLGESLDQKQPFTDLSLTEKTKWFVQQNLHGKELIRLNRLLLEAAFGDQIGKHHDYTIYQVSQNSSSSHQTITEAIYQWQEEKPHHAVIEILDSGVYVEQINIHLGQNQTLQLRAADYKRPVIRIMPFDSKYRGAENQLYRVEIFEVSTGPDSQKITFVWSRDNSSVVFPIVKFSGLTLTVEHLKRDDCCSLSIGDWVEVVYDDYVLDELPRKLFKVDKIDPIENQVTLKENANSQKASTNSFDWNLLKQGQHPLLRRWDSGAINVELKKTKEDDNSKNEEWIALEDGVEVQFPKDENHNKYQVGDYWLIPARTATGDVEWPKIENENQLIPDAQKPHGIAHYYGPLAIVSVAKDEVKSEDCRRQILSELKPPTVT